MGDLKEWLETSLTDGDLAELADRDRAVSARAVRPWPARSGRWFRLKAALSVDLVRDLGKGDRRR
ncbi:MAG: hypothetical protein Ct9H300mP1_26420 [Planctomycetaceae bacterium]|nr:MAG: hypothetical protein Ct9H300mP1_26420 [Planctomycetaceae bacterium]